MTRWRSLRVNVAPLLRQHDNRAQFAYTPSEDQQIVVKETVTASELTITTAGIADGTPITVDGNVRRTAGGVEFHGRLTSTWVAECRRCVETVTGDIDQVLRATFVADAEVSSDDEADAYPIEGDWIDVGDMVFEELMLSLPLTPLCSDECMGADPDRFPAIVIEAQGGERHDPDPRWAPLSEISFDED